MKKQKILCILLAIMLLFIFSVSSFASNNGLNANQTANNQNSNTEGNTENSEEPLDPETLDKLNTLGQQKSDIQASLDKVNEQLEYVQGEMSGTLIQIQELNDQIMAYEQENDGLKTRLQTIQASIEEEKNNLEIATKEYNEKDEELRKRLVTLYESGEISYLDVLLSAKSLSEFLSLYYVMVEMAEYDNQLMDEVDRRIQEIEYAKEKLEKETKEVTELKIKAEQSETILRNTKAMQQKYIAQLSDEERKLNEQVVKFKNELIIIEAKIRQVDLLNADLDIQYLGGEMIWPVAIAGTGITSYYGTRIRPNYGVVMLHQGIDIGNTGYGAPVVAVMDGVVTFAGELGSYGNCVMIYHGNGITTLYGHAQTILTEGGKEVKQGELIMQTGDTGNTTGPHLHFEVRINGVTQDPLNYFKVDT